ARRPASTRPARRPSSRSGSRRPRRARNAPGSTLGCLRMARGADLRGAARGGEPRGEGMRSIGPVLLVAVGAALAGAPAGAASDRARCEPTPSDGGGSDRGTAPLRAKIGTGHVLTGVVLSPSCRPIAGATVSFWQSNRKGVCTSAGRGAVITDRRGRFRFEGPRPV